MIKFFGIISALAVSSIAGGCAVPPKMYYWGDYSKSVYACRKDGTDEQLIKHKQVLETIIEESQQHNCRVPPGVYAELGYIYFRQNKNDDAIRFFDLEAKTYPEAGILMERLTQAAKAKGQEK